MERPPTFEMILAIAVLFVGVWIGASFLLASLGGWSALARRFRTDRPRPGNHQTTTGRFGLVRYKSILVVGWSSEGLHLSVWRLWRSFHPPLLVPWHAIKGCRGGGVGPFRRVTLEVEAGQRVVSLHLDPDLVEAFREWLPRCDE